MVATAAVLIFARCFFSFLRWILKLKRLKSSDQRQFQRIHIAYEFETSKINSHDWLLSWSPKMFTKAVCDVCNLAPCGELWRSKMETLKTCRWTRWTLDEDGAFRGISMDLDGSRRISTLGSKVAGHISCRHIS